MSYTCSVCQAEVPDDLVVFMNHTEGHIVEEIKAKHPDWVENDGLCQKCVDYYKNQIKGED